MEYTIFLAVFRLSFLPLEDSGGIMLYHLQEGHRALVSCNLNQSQRRYGSACPEFYEGEK